jgi:methyl-accepting chemotaxis protein
MRRAIMRPLSEAVGMARRVAAGDLRARPGAVRHDEFGLLLQALEEMRGQLHALVGGVRGSVDSVATAASEIATGNMDLSNRTERQAASLAAAAHAVQRVSDSIGESADGAQSASTSADAMFAAAQRDGERVGQVVGTMQRIREATQRIQQITGLIDGIAMQTHILGLNASVEASNAGERGRGFAVVAASVRELAERCREAAAEVRRLVAEAGVHADSGSQLARQAGEGIAALIAHAQAVSENIGSISRAAQAQRDAIGAIGASMSEIDGATQQNAALVEEAAAAAQSLKDQADRLAESVAAFKLA